VRSSTLRSRTSFHSRSVSSSVRFSPSAVERRGAVADICSSARSGDAAPLLAPSGLSHRSNALVKSRSAGFPREPAAEVVVATAEVVRGRRQPVNGRAIDRLTKKPMPSARQAKPAINAAVARARAARRRHEQRTQDRVTCHRLAVTSANGLPPSPVGHSPDPRTVDGAIANAVGQLLDARVSTGSNVREMPPRESRPGTRYLDRTAAAAAGQTFRPLGSRRKASGQAGGKPHRTDTIA